MTKKSNNDLIILAGVAIGGYFLLSGKAAGSGSEGGSFVVPSIPGETQPQNRDIVVSGGAGTGTGTGTSTLSTTKKELTTAQYNQLSSYIPILNSPGVQANPITQTKKQVAPSIFNAGILKLGQTPGSF
jgi:hypothetical protein